jgi:hypothetical protein
VIIGVDPHKATHTAVAIDRNEVELDSVGGTACASVPSGPAPAVAVEV